MRMVCDSTYIVDPLNRHDTKVEEIIEIIQEIMTSSDEKIIIFSEWKRMHHLIIQSLDQTDFCYVYLHGGLSSQKRGEIIQEFKSDPDIRIFLSTDAGGQGLNLQEASVIINVDLPWNQAVLEQRIGRIHRIGQNRNIRVINLITTNTIEHGMLNRLRFKSGMAAGILDGGDADVFVNDENFEKIINTISEDIDLANSSQPEIQIKEDQDVDFNKEEIVADHTEDIENIMMKNESLGEQVNDDNQKNEAEISTDRQSEQLSEIMNQGMKFLSGMLQMMTGNASTFKDQKIEIDAETGEVVMRFKVDNLKKK